MPGQALRVLVVADDAVSQRLLLLALVEEGYDVDVTDCGAAAIMVALEASPAAIVLDPGLAAADLGQRLRDALGSAVRIVVLSASPGIAEYARAMRADAFLAKPFDLVSLLATLERLLKRG